jgi:hypothetical protein
VLSGREVRRVNRPRRTIKRRTTGNHRGAQLVLIVPPECDVIYVRQARRRKVLEIDLASVFDLAAKREAIARRAARRRA